MASRSRRGVIIAVIVVVVAAGAFLGGRTLWRAAQSALAYDHCTVGTYDIDPDQAATASTMVGAVTSYQPALPERAAVLVLAAGLQESKLHNLAPGAGDRDSVGVLQQRPSQDWGKVPGQPDSIADRTKRLADPFFATTAFLNHLIQVPKWQSIPLADAVQAVQVSADGSAYAQHESEAQALADALQGHRSMGITCTFQKPTKVAMPAEVAAQVSAELPVSHPMTSATSIAVRGAGWQTAAWFVAHADRFGIESVAFNGQKWTRSDGWKPDTGATASVVLATMHQV
ncbi:MAG: hypothetical protein ABI301_06280 [Jatrophihabitantaceae bacterium]